MKKGAIAAVVVVVVAAYPASAWFLGKQIESIASKNNERITAVPYIKLTQYNYDRSLFSADETLTIEMPAELFAMPSRPAKAADSEDEQDAAKESTPAAPKPPIRVTIKSHIQHGPLIDFSIFAAGRAETTVEFEGQLQQAVSEAFGGKPVISAQTLFDFQGGGQTAMNIPAFKKIIQAGKEADRQVTISGDGMQATMNFSKSMAQYSFQASMPRLEMALPDNGSVKMLNMRLEGDQQRIFEDNPIFYSGTQKFSVAEISADPGTADESGAQKKISVKELTYDVQVPVSGDFIDMIAKTGANVVQVGEQNYGPARYDLSIKHLHARKTLALYQNLMALYAKPENLQTPQQMAQAMAPMKGQFIGLLQDSPQLSLDRISFRTPEGEAELAASIKLDNAKAEDFANPMRLLPKVDFAANFALPAKLLTSLAGKQPINKNHEGGVDEEELQARAQKTERTMNYLAQQGYASLDNGIFKSKITFKAGQLLVSDKPFNPMAMMMQMQTQEDLQDEEEE